jgi:hypothetical protein
LLLGDLAVGAQNRAPAPSGQPQLNISIDARRNEAYVKADSFKSFVYSATRNGNTITVQPASKNIVGFWKGGIPLVPVSFNDDTYFEVPGEFAPAFLIADFKNDTSSPITVTNAYLDVAESTSDNHPYLEIPSRADCADGSYDPGIELQNYGWKPVLQPKFTFTFAAGNVQSKSFVSAFPTFDQNLIATVEGALKQAGANIIAIKRGSYRCASHSQVPSCFAKLKETRIFGELGNNVYVENNIVFSDVSGTIDYSWVDYKGATIKSTAPFKVSVPLGKFAFVAGPECGAEGPIDRNEHPIIFPLDRQGYRIPLNWHTRMLPRQEQKFSLSLASRKASHDVFKVVLQLSDGRTISSPVIDMSYFTPRMK